ncbi:MAG: hypothetical protein WDN31_21585 [Hyphomicrobium sp.]
MVIVRIFANAVIMAGEVASVVALAAFAFYYPFLFAAVTAALSFLLGLQLEVARLRYELPFYFGGLAKRAAFFTALVGSFEALFKGVLAGVASLFTFAGTNTDRLSGWRCCSACASTPARRCCASFRCAPMRCPCAGGISAWRHRWGCCSPPAWRCLPWPPSCRRPTSPTSAGRSFSIRRRVPRSSR